MKNIILGSGSPRRRELLSALGVDFTVDTATSFKESLECGAKAAEIPVMMSTGKSHGFHRTLDEDEILITADTVVIVDDKVLGKPHSREEAVMMIRLLSGRTHNVVTAVTIRDSRQETTFSDVTKVTFRVLVPEEIDYYIDNYKPYDKAGAYGVQEWIGFVGITSIEGSFYNVMGFPVHCVWSELKKFL